MSADSSRSAARILSRRRADALRRAEDRRRELYARFPQLRSFDREITGLCLRAAASAPDGGEAREIRDAYGDLREKRARFLAEAGLSEEDFLPRFTCPLCGDTGYADGRRCGCLEALLRDEALRRLPAGILKLADGFDGFDLSFYSDRKDETGVSPRVRMRNIFERIRDYATRFSPSESGNLLLTGRTGLGKTHLSVCVAREVIARGYDVLYFPAQEMIGVFERTAFSREAPAGDAGRKRAMFSCDLLIIDDLGSEFVTAFTQGVLYDVVNTRLVAGRPTVISTNLDPRQLADLYSERVVSRLIGNYTLLGFVGQDIRQLKLMRERRT